MPTYLVQSIHLGPCLDQRTACALVAIRGSAVERGVFGLRALGYNERLWGRSMDGRLAWGRSMDGCLAWGRYMGGRLAWGRSMGGRLAWGRSMEGRLAKLRGQGRRAFQSHPRPRNRFESRNRECRAFHPTRLLLMSHNLIIATSRHF